MVIRRRKVMKIRINKGAIERRYIEDEIIDFDGTLDELVEFLDGLYVDCCANDEDELRTFEEWSNIYEDEADISGSTIVYEITDNKGNVIFQAFNEEV
jgi:hypothetical protein